MATRIFRMISIFSFLCLALSLRGEEAQAAFISQDVPLTILHTNDLHSHFKPETHPFVRGGLARIKTEIDRIKRIHKNTILVDAGDWSEGSIFYTHNGGLDTVSLMEQMGYELAVIGNHDYLNGPDQLLRMIESATPQKIEFLAANLSSEHYERSSDFQRRILPYVIKTYQGKKVAFIGLTTYEFIYDKFINPIQIQEPLFSTRDLAAELKAQGMDGIVVISHNGSWVNKKLLSISPEIDLVIGAHDHLQYNTPQIVEGGLRTRPGWLVETGQWGRNLGQVEVLLSKGEMKLIRGELIQMDETVSEDASIARQIEQIENNIEQKMGPVFHDLVGENDLKVGDGPGNEHPITQLITDAYLEASQADFALENHKFVYGELNPGIITTADVFDLNPAIFNSSTQKSWTLKVLPIQGRVLKWLLYIAYGTHKLGSAGLFDASGLTFNYDPLFAASYDDSDDNSPPEPEDPYHFQKLFFNAPQPQKSGHLEAEAFPVVQNILIRGKPLDPDHTYTMATGGGLIEAFEFINQNILNLIPLSDLTDTGIENWRVTLQFLQSKAHLKREDLTHGDRIRTLQSDLGIHQRDVQWIPVGRSLFGALGKVRVQVRNFGNQPFNPHSQSNPRITLYMNENAYQLNRDPIYVKLGESKLIPKLNPGECTTLEWNSILIPSSKPNYPITVKIEGAEHEVNPYNHETTLWLN